MIVAIVLVVVGVALGLWFVHLPWAATIRWIAATSTLDPGITNSFLVREVRVVSVSERSGRAHVAVVPSTASLQGFLTPSDRARLERWSAARTPLLLAWHPDGSVELHGPQCCVGGLRELSPPHPGSHGLDDAQGPRAA
jgi:hypothetical protein